MKAGHWSAYIRAKDIRTSHLMTYTTPAELPVARSSLDGHILETRQHKHGPSLACQPSLSRHHVHVTGNLLTDALMRLKRSRS